MSYPLNPIVGEHVSGAAELARALAGFALPAIPGFPAIPPVPVDRTPSPTLDLRCIAANNGGLCVLPAWHLASDPHVNAAGERWLDGGRCVDCHDRESWFPKHAHVLDEAPAPSPTLGEPSDGGFQASRDTYRQLKAKADALAADRLALAPWRALTAALYTPALVEAVLQDWRGRDPEARVSWDHDWSGRGVARFFLAYRSYRASIAAVRGRDWHDLSTSLQCAWQCALEHDHRQRAGRGR